MAGRYFVTVFAATSDPVGIGFTLLATTAESPPIIIEAGEPHLVITPTRNDFWGLPSLLVGVPLPSGGSLAQQRLRVDQWCSPEGCTWSHTLYFASCLASNCTGEERAPGPNTTWDLRSQVGQDGGDSAVFLLPQAGNESALRFMGDYPDCYAPTLQCPGPMALRLLLTSDDAPLGNILPAPCVSGTCVNTFNGSRSLVATYLAPPTGTPGSAPPPSPSLLSVTACSSAVAVTACYASNPWSACYNSSGGASPAWPSVFPVNGSDDRGTTNTGGANEYTILRNGTASAQLPGWLTASIVPVAGASGPLPLVEVTIAAGPALVLSLPVPLVTAPRVVRSDPSSRANGTWMAVTWDAALLGPLDGSAPFSTPHGLRYTVWAVPVPLPPACAPLLHYNRDTACGMLAFVQEAHDRRLSLLCAPIHSQTVGGLAVNFTAFKEPLLNALVNYSISVVATCAPRYFCLPVGGNGGAQSIAYVPVTATTHGSLPSSSPLRSPLPSLSPSASPPAASGGTPGNSLAIGVGVGVPAAVLAAAALLFVYRGRLQRQGGVPLGNALTGPARRLSPAAAGSPSVHANFTESMRDRLLANNNSDED